MNRKNREHLDVALPNKVFEYIACGLPVLAFPHKNLKEVLDRYNVGMVFDSVDEMASQLQSGELESIRGDVLNSRHKLTVEKNIGRLIQYYKEMEDGAN